MKSYITSTKSIFPQFLSKLKVITIVSISLTIEIIQNKFEKDQFYNILTIM